MGERSPAGTGRRICRGDRHRPGEQCFYAPVDLEPSRHSGAGRAGAFRGNPQFHQQMVYAVAMTTITHFERALGRVALWAPRRSR